MATCHVSRQPDAAYFFAASATRCSWSRCSRHHRRNFQGRTRHARDRLQHGNIIQLQWRLPAMATRRVGRHPDAAYFPAASATRCSWSNCRRHYRRNFQHRLRLARDRLQRCNTIQLQWRHLAMATRRVGSRPNAAYFLAAGASRCKWWSKCRRHHRRNFHRRPRLTRAGLQRCNR